MGEYYTSDKIRATGADMMITFSRRGPGKSYDDKKHTIDDYIRDESQFFYLRRQAKQLKDVKFKTYFADMTKYLTEQMNGYIDGAVRYDIYPSGGCWYIGAYSNDGEYTRLGCIGYYDCLMHDEDLKSGSFPNVTKITFEEFMSREYELDDEMTMLTSIISTVRRNRDNVIVRLLGNTVNSNNQIMRALNIDPRKIAQGEIKVFDYFGDDGVRTRVAVENCDRDVGKTDSKFANFGRQKEAMIVNGEWETDEYKLYETIPELLITDNFVVTDGVRRLYVYADGIRGQMYISSRREDVAGRYITLTNDATNISRDHYNWACNYAPIVKCKQALKTIINNGNVQFDNYLTGDDFFYIVRGRM